MQVRMRIGVECAAYVGPIHRRRKGLPSKTRGTIPARERLRAIFEPVACNLRRECFRSRASIWLAIGVRTPVTDTIPFLTYSEIVPPPPYNTTPPDPTVTP